MQHLFAILKVSSGVSLNPCSSVCKQRVYISLVSFTMQDQNLDMVHSLGQLEMRF